MLYVLSYLLFLVSVALAAGGVVLASKLRKQYEHPLFSSLFYFLVFIYTFGFYGIWGQVVINAFLPEYIPEELLTRISELALLMGLPFLVFGWMMLLFFSSDISGRKQLRWFSPVFLVLNFTILIFMGYFATRKNMDGNASLAKYFYIVMNLAYSLISSIIIISGYRRPGSLNRHDRKIIAAAIILIMIMQSMPLLFYSSNKYLALLFILLYFTGNTFLPFYMRYGAFLQQNAADKSGIEPFEDFCRHFEVSPREKDIILEICNGLSNKEISDKLFISLQTVKDHTHRIYIKTNVRSRVQLINLVKGSRGG